MASVASEAQAEDTYPMGPWKTHVELPILTPLQEPIELDAGRYVVDFRSGQEVEIEVTSGQQRVLRIGRGTHIE